MIPKNCLALKCKKEKEKKVLSWIACWGSSVPYACGVAGCCRLLNLLFVQSFKWILDSMRTLSNAFEVIMYFDAWW